MNILLVDDSTAISTLGKRILEGAGHTVQYASNGYVAIELIVNNIYDCLILDIEMPEVDGLSLCRLLSTHESYRHIPKIILSGNSGEFDKAKGVLSGAKQYVIKPFDKTSLLNAIERCVR
jgi:twitching motility two-component system response regulator PilG